MRTVLVIPARGGSKGIPRKNLQEIGGTPLLVSAIRRALASKVDRVIVSTEDMEIRDVALASGADVPFVRPRDVARDSDSLIDVLRHAVEELETQGDRFDAIGSLQPTAPFLSSSTIDRCLETFGRSRCDAVVTVRRIVHNHPYRAYRRSAEGSLQCVIAEGERALQRQDLPEMFALSGGLYLRRTELIKEWSRQDFALGRTCVGVEVAEVEGLNIDTPFDLALARYLADSGGGVPDQHV